VLEQALPSSLSVQDFIHLLQFLEALVFPGVQLNYTPVEVSIGFAGAVQEPWHQMASQQLPPILLR
jgi:hypothetical protein